MNTNTNSPAAATERELRLAAELARHNPEVLEKPCYDLQDAPEMLRELSNEAGYWSAKSCLDEASLWDLTLREAIGYLVDDIYTLDGELYDSLAELRQASDPRLEVPEDFNHPNRCVHCDAPVDQEGRYLPPR